MGCGANNRMQTVESHLDVPRTGLIVTSEQKGNLNPDIETISGQASPVHLNLKSDSEACAPVDTYGTRLGREVRERTRRL